MAKLSLFEDEKIDKIWAISVILTQMTSILVTKAKHDLINCEGKAII